MPSVTRTHFTVNWTHVTASHTVNFNHTSKQQRQHGPCNTPANRSAKKRGRVSWRLKMICNDFLPTWLKVVSSCLLQSKPVCVTNFDKLCRRMLKITSLLVFLVYLFFGMCDVIPWIRLFCLRCYALLRLDKKLILPVYVLRTYFYVVMPMCCVMSHSTLQ